MPKNGEEGEVILRSEQRSEEGNLLKRQAKTDINRSRVVKQGAAAPSAYSR